MAQIREIRKRIRSIKSTQKVTHAMELVAAAKMRKAQFATLSGRPYLLSLNEIIEIIRRNSEKINSYLFKKNKAGKQLIIIVSSDRGLAGGLNINIFREILRNDFKDAAFITVGKKALTFAAKTKSETLASFEAEEKTEIELSRLLSKMAAESFKAEEFYQVTAVYPHFESAVTQPPKWQKILPIELEEVEEKNTDQDLIFEPSIQEIVKALLPHYVLTKIYQILLEAKASEHSARMVAMKNATEAAEDLVSDLTLTFNQVRQEAITKELLDIVTAQKAFE